MVKFSRSFWTIWADWRAPKFKFRWISKSRIATNRSSVGSYDEINSAILDKSFGIESL